MMINDKSFLKQLDLERNKNLYAKIIALDLDENPIEQIEGKILPGGSFNIDGQSAVRRTCSLTIQTDREDINNYNWALKHKFKVFIGIENNINEKYDDIIWFKQGIYVITSFSLSRQTKSLTVSIQGQDKMCLLNGTISGNLPCSVDFQKKELYDNSYEPVSFGQMYIKDKYYTFKEDNFVLKLDDSEEFLDKKFEWKLVVTFKDNSTKKSQGVNNSPRKMIHMTKISMAIQMLAMEKSKKTHYRENPDGSLTFIG